MVKSEDKVSAEELCIRLKLYSMKEFFEDRRLVWSSGKNERGWFWFAPYALFWKIPLTSSQSRIVILIYYHSSGNNNIRQGVGKFGVISKWIICCVPEKGQDFGIFEESQYQGMLFDTNTYWKVVFVSMFWQ